MIDEARDLRLNRLLQPRSIAVVGASPERRSIARIVLENLAAFDYAGDVHLVSRTRREIGGKPCVASIADLPPGVDVAVLCIPQAAVAETLVACAENGVGSVALFASGYAETGAEGRAAQDELAAFARAHDMPLLGPNCMGFANLVDGIPVAFTEFTPPPQPPREAIAVVAQSGAMMGNITLALTAKGRAVSYAVSTGNEAGVAIDDLVAYLLDDAATRTIVVLAEQIRRPQRFLAAATRARALGKPLVLLHPGRSARARASAATHTGALAGDHRVMEMLVREHGVALVRSFDELFDVADLLDRVPTPPAAGGIGIVTNSGAFGGFALDACEEVGVAPAALSAPTQERLRAVLPPYLSVEHFVDLGTAGKQDADVYGETVRALLADDGVAALLVALVAASPQSQLAKAHSLAPVLRVAPKPLALAILGDASPLDPAFLALVPAREVAFFRSPERALRALAAVVAYGRWCPSPPTAPLEPPLPDLGPLSAGMLTEHGSKALLRAIGIAVPDGEVVGDVDRAAEVARRIGYPLVLKVHSEEHTHKSDVGGVVLGIADEAALRRGWDDLARSERAARPALRPAGVLVETLAPPAVELVVGARRDPDWGPVTLVGLGGVWVEALDDVRLLPADASEERVVAELGLLRGARVLRGARGRPAVDVCAVARVAVRIGALMLAHPEIAEIDVNPLIAGAAGAIAVDALIRVGTPPPG